jgi:DNA invertase Pin-like site-specific DNA recombinase
MPGQPVPAAQYVRMSTEHQQYSLVNQSSAIQLWAVSHGFNVTKTYYDAAKSGLSFKKRAGLRQLLDDVVNGTSGCAAILVYDVSRWGRFQDTDEAAHYEFICKSAGVPIHYCAEQFSNDGSMPSIILKSLKRTMAAEYSRDLSTRVFAGQKRICEMGFRLGSTPGYGLRRMLVSSDRKQKHELRSREWKSITTDRVILVPGPAHEVKIVREIYQMLLTDGFTVLGIAQELNRRGVKYLGEAAWSNHAVYRILTSPKYAGFSVFGRTSTLLMTPPIRKPASDWVIAENAFTPIVDHPTFVAAQQVLANRVLCRTKEYLLSQLRVLFVTEGKLSTEIIAKSSNTPSPATYIKQFGSLIRAYELVGAQRVRSRTPKEAYRRNQSLRETLVSQIAAMFPLRVSVVRQPGNRRVYLVVDKAHPVSVSLARVIARKPTTIRWRYDGVLREYGRPTLLARIDMSCQGFKDFFVFPPMTLMNSMNLRAHDKRLRRGIRLENLSKFPDVVNEVCA